MDPTPLLYNVDGERWCVSVYDIQSRIVVKEMNFDHVDVRLKIIEFVDLDDGWSSSKID